MSNQEEMGTLDLDENGCAPDCPVRLLGEQSGERKSGAKRRMTSIGYGVEENHTFDREVDHEASTGAASRYFKTFRPMVDDYDTSCYNAGNNVEVNQCQKSHIHGESLESQMEDGIANGDTLGTENNIVNLSTDGYGSKPTDLSPQDTKYTTSTMTRPTTDLKTSNALQQRNTTTITSDSERTTVSMTRESKNGNVNDANTSSPLTNSTLDGQEAITDIANLAVLRNLESGVAKTESALTNIKLTGTMPTKGLYAPGHEDSNSRFFKTFPPEPTLWDMAEEDAPS